MRDFLATGKRVARYLTTLIISVSNPYSLNPDPAKNLNPNQDPSYFLTLSEFFFLHNFIITRFSHQKKSIEKFNVEKSLKSKKNVVKVTKK